jgi:hypothetical protein
MPSVSLTMVVWAILILGEPLKMMIFLILKMSSSRIMMTQTFIVIWKITTIIMILRFTIT